MSRSEKKQNSNPVSLFPFLAVLLCTMGALVVLLVAMAEVSRQGAAAAAQVAEAEAESAQAAKEAIDPEAEARLSQANAYLAKLDQVQQKANKSLSDDRMRLAQAEDHIRRLREELMALRLAAMELEGLAEEHYDDQAQAERELKRLNELIATAEADVEQLKAEKEDDSKSYAIVPYTGPNGTRRRPIYIECVSDRIVLQPEGITLTPKDFEPPIGVDNPLAAAVRAARLYYVRKNTESAGDPDPYPLVLVRPEGIDTYGLVRQAIGQLDNDFGFQFIESDWKLEFPQADPELAKYESMAIDNARLRLAALAKSAPGAYERSSRVTSEYYASGEIAPNIEPYNDAILDTIRRADERAQVRAATGRESSKDLKYRENRVSNRDKGAGGEGSAYDELAKVSEAGQVPSQSRVEVETTNSAEANELSAADSENSHANPSSNGSMSNQGAPSQLASTTSQGSAGQGSPGEATNEVGGGISSITTNQRIPNGASPSLSKPQEAKDTDIAMSRAIQIVVQDNRLLFVSDPNAATASDPSALADGVINFKGTTRDQMPEFFKQVEKRIVSWGYSGAGLYWKPVLILNVTADGESRAREMASLLRKNRADIRIRRLAKQPQKSMEGGGHATR